MSGGEGDWTDDVGLDGERRPGRELDGAGCVGDENGECCGDRRAVDVTCTCDGRGGCAFASEIAFDVEGPSETDSSPSAPSLSLPRSLLLSLPRLLFRAIWRSHSNGSSPTRRRTRRESFSGMPSLRTAFPSRLPSSMFCRMVSKKGLKAT